MQEHVKHAYRLYVIVVQTENLTADHDTIMNAIQAENVGIGIHFRALHLHPYYRQTFGFCEGMFPNAEYVSQRVISLPLCPAMTEKRCAISHRSYQESNNRGPIVLFIHRRGYCR